MIESRLKRHFVTKIPYYRFWKGNRWNSWVEHRNDQALLFQWPSFYKDHTLLPSSHQEFKAFQEGSVFSQNEINSSGRTGICMQVYMLQGFLLDRTALGLQPKYPGGFSTLTARWYMLVKNSGGQHKLYRKAILCFPFLAL